MRFALPAMLLCTAFATAADPWALQPVKRPDPPKRDAAGAKWAKTPIDAFVWAKLAEKKLTPNGPADPRSLLRRVHFDLTGLPPSPEQLEAFAKNPSDDAYSKIVDELLASPHYGERWARHWLDVARYGESDGFERNAPRPTAWHYRDWIIKALNADMPFDQFAKRQLAGDVLDPDGDGVKATGFLVAGIHNTVLGSNKVANLTARQDELEDVIATVGQTFIGLTVQCARCHDHKFDPVDQGDYYRLVATLGGVTHGERTATNATAAAARGKLTADRDAVSKKLATLELQVRERVKPDGKKATAVPPLARWSFEKDATDSVGTLHGELKGGAKVANGRLVLDGKAAFVQTAPLVADLTEKTLEVWAVLPDLTTRGGGLLTVEAAGGGTFDSIVFGERQTKRWVVGSEGFRRTKDLTIADETVSDRPVHVAAVYGKDGGITLYRDGELLDGTYTPNGVGLQTYPAKTARVLLGLRHTGGGMAYFRGEIEEARLYDKALSAAEVKASTAAGPDAVGVTAEAMLAAMTAAERADHAKWVKERADVDAKLKAVPAPEKVFATVSTAVPVTHILHRGSVEKPKKEVKPGAVASVPGESDFDLTAKATDGDRRKKLAEWVARADNPLFTRVIVNRLWHHHFGVGIVETPSDFGANGGKPSHPELLDWLAAELVAPTASGTAGASRLGGSTSTLPADAGGSSQKRPAPWSLKHLHRLIVLSAAYRQSSAANPAAAKLDADNRLLWRKSPTRLEAEAVRDAILAVSGDLDRTVGGPPFHDVKTYENNGTTYYQPLDALPATANRRTVYRFSPRGERNAVLETFDCPDPSAQTPRRQTTTTPLQSLALWNDAFVLRSAEKFAERVTTDCQRGSVEEKVKWAYRLAIGRDPTADEAKPAAALVEKHGLKALGRVLFNCSEFVVLE